MSEEAGSSSAGPKRSIDTAWEAAVAPKKVKSASLSDSEVKASVNKMIYDNLRDMTTQELDSNLDSRGMTCRQTLHERKLQNMEDPVMYKIGKNFYTDCRRTYRSKDNPKAKIEEVAATVDTAINPRLLQSMSNYVKTGQRAAVLGYMSLCEALTDSEILGIFNFALDIIPQGCTGDQLKHAYAVLDCFTRLSIQSKKPNYWLLIRDWVDDVLVQVLATSKALGKKPTTFWSTHRKVLILVMNEEQTQRILDNTGGWEQVEASLVSVVHASKIGSKLFSCATQQVFGELVTREIGKGVATTFAMPRVTAASLMKEQQRVIDAIRKINGMDLYDEKRKITLCYRGRDFGYQCKSLADEIDMSFMTHLKSAAVNCGDLVPVFCEMSLCDGGPRGLKGQISDDILGRCRAARVQVNRGLDGAKNKDGANVLTHLAKERKSVELTDSTFLVEIQFFTGMVGKDGEAALFSMVRNYMPGPEPLGSKTIENVLTSVSGLASRSIYKFCDTASQNQVTTMVSLLTDLHQGRSPKFASSSSDFLVECKQAMRNFARCTLTIKGKDTELVAERAVTEMAKRALQGDQATKTLADLEGPTRFGWMLSNDQRAQIAELRQKVTEGQRTLASAGAGAIVAVAAPKGRAKAKAKASASSEISQAMAMFGRK